VQLSEDLARLRKDYLDTYAETIRLGKVACEHEDVPCDAPAELVEAILAARRAGQQVAGD